jgi:hypothetical protein
MVSGIRRQVYCGVTGQGPAAATPSLVEDDRHVARGIIISPTVRGSWRTRTAVQPHRRETIGRAHDLPIHGMTVANVEVAAIVWLDGRVHADDLPRREGRHKTNATRTRFAAAIPLLSWQIRVPPT